MNADNTFLKKQIILQFFIVSNYLLYLINAKTIFIITNCLLILFYLFNVIIDNFNRRIILTKITIIIYIIISIGSPLTEWDARSIWLFHGKRLFFDNSFYSILDNYFQISHNDYPLLAATLSACLANLIGSWNEIFPKFANIILMTSPIIFLSYILKNKVKEMLFVFVIIFIMEKRIIVGEMDMLNSIYFVLTIVCFGFLLFNSNNKNNLNKNILIYTILNLIIYSHIRPESFYFSILIFLSAIFINFFKKEKLKTSVFIYLSLSFIPIFFWKYLVANSGITTITEHIFDLHLLKEKIFIFSLHFKIFELLFYSKNSIISIMFLMYFIFSFIKLEKNSDTISYNKNLILANPIAFYILLFAIVYFGIIYISILGSATDDMFNEIGRFRYNLPVSISICYATILFKYQKNINLK
jgi:hypothetical protein